MQKTLDAIPRETLMKEIKEMRPTMAKRARRMREVPLVDEALEYSKELEAAVVAQAAPVGEEA